MTDINLMKESYSKHNNLKLAADELGMGWQNLYYHLKKNGVSVVGDKTKYGSASDKLAAKAELLFSKIVPYATNNNEKTFQAKIDFYVNDLKIDIKSSELHFSSKKFKSKRWAFSLKRQEMFADFFVAFGYEGEKVTIFLFPSEIIKHYQTISINPYGQSKWLQYMVTEPDLLEFFNNFSEPLQGS